jgi:hypothetical protein
VPHLVIFGALMDKILNWQKKPRTPILGTFATVEKLSFFVQPTNTMQSFSFKFKLCMIFNIEKCCPKMELEF